MSVGPVSLSFSQRNCLPCSMRRVAVHIPPITFIAKLLLFLWRPLSHAKSILICPKILSAVIGMSSSDEMAFCGFAARCAEKLCFAGTAQKGCGYAAIWRTAAEPPGYLITFAEKQSFFAHRWAKPEEERRDRRQETRDVKQKLHKCFTHFSHARRRIILFTRNSTCEPLSQRVVNVKIKGGELCHT